MYKIFIATAISFLLSGCGSIKHTSSIQQPLDTPLMAGVGDVVVKINKEKSLPNVAGKADLFGRTTPTGTTTVIYRGISKGHAIFERRSVDIETGATTMNSSPLVIPNTTVTNTTGNVGSRAFNAQSVTTGAPIVIAPNTPQVQVSDRNAILVTIDLTSLPAQMLVDGTLITVTKAESGVVSYSLKASSRAQ